MPWVVPRRGLLQVPGCLVRSKTLFRGASCGMGWRVKSGCSNRRVAVAGTLEMVWLGEQGGLRSRCRGSPMAAINQEER